MLVYVQLYISLTYMYTYAFTHKILSFIHTVMSMYIRQ